MKDQFQVVTTGSETDKATAPATRRNVPHRGGEPNPSANAIAQQFPGAVIAVWNYPRPEFVDRDIDRPFLEFYRDVVGPYWPPERRHVESNYTTLPFPFEELPHPEFGLTLRWNLVQVLGYVSSWSATTRYRKARADDPVPLLRASLQGAWPGDGAIVEIRLPIGLRAARLD